MYCLLPITYYLLLTAYYLPSGCGCMNILLDGDSEFCATPLELDANWCLGQAFSRQKNSIVCPTRRCLGLDLQFPHYMQMQIGKLIEQQFSDIPASRAHNVQLLHNNTDAVAKHLSTIVSKATRRGRNEMRGRSEELFGKAMEPSWPLDRHWPNKIPSKGHGWPLAGPRVVMCCW